ncbi:uncharacterized protein N7496_007324 [Penicillium cataractarum]|uniref:D-xylose 1-dehydrogenase (NADP(+), D-xylono-1,5-lactone-forming) n=1 Tax=Penicillium cataractarum TaxID=2100454 RepID=A0A9W9V755_9EURO|nr:uncharacterized protein N7496_007324 [Penicillium cataractarum]KAJ5371232.1 hypothetical protein N7496_007324 [Penicillium cataractarum]
MTYDKPTVRWGIVATGLISSWFVKDIVLERSDAKANHFVQAIGSSSVEKGQNFVKEHLPGKSPTIYGSYQELYTDPNVDIIYIGTPHAFHKQNALNSIAHGKHVLCEKAFTLNAAETREVLNAAKEKGVYIMEAMWTRHFPLVRTLQKLLHKDKVIGEIQRTFCDFAMDMKIAEKGPESRLKNPALGAGTLLDIGIYSLTWSIIGLEPPLGMGEKPLTAAPEKPKILAAQTLSDEIDISTSIILHYADGRQGIATSNAVVKSSSPSFCRIEGTEGVVFVYGRGPSMPDYFTVRKLNGEETKYEFEKPGMGFFWEADAVAVDVAAGRTESTIMPWAETLRVMEILDEARRQGGARFPQDPRN